MTDTTELRRLSPEDREKINVIINRFLCGYGPDDPQWYTVDHLGALLDRIEALEAEKTEAQKMIVAMRKAFVQIQNECGIHANAISTKALALTLETDV